MTDLAVREIRSCSELSALEPQWWDLFRRARSATPFQSPAWLLPWWRAFQPGDLFSLAVHDGGRLMGLAPGYIEAGRLERRILPVGISVSDYLDILVDGEDPDAVLSALVAHIGRLPSWDSWELTELEPSATALRVRPAQEWRESTGPVSACPVLDLPARVEDLDLAIPARKRRDLRAAWHRAQRRGAVEIAEATVADAETALGALCDLHRARWQSRGEQGVLADDRVRRFHDETVPALLRQGLARLYALSIGGTTAGVYYGFRHRARAYGYLTGLDPAFAFESPGTILIGHALAAAVRDGAREFHFLRGREKYKYQWGARDRWNRRRVFVRERAHAAAS